MSDRSGKYRGITGYIHAHDFGDLEEMTESVLYEWEGVIYRMDLKWSWPGWIPEDAAAKKQRCNRLVGAEYRFMSSIHEKKGQRATDHEAMCHREYEVAAERRREEKYGAGFKG